MQRKSTHIPGKFEFWILSLSGSIYGCLKSLLAFILL